MNPKRFLLTLLLLILLTACGQGTSTKSSPEVLPTVTPPPPPEAGKATLIGLVTNKLTGQPLGNTIVRLAEVARGAEGRGGAFILDVGRSPGTITDQTGHFIIANIEAGEYVIVVGDVEITGVYEIIAQADGRARVWMLPADQITDVGELRVSISPPIIPPTVTPGPYPAPTAYP